MQSARLAIVLVVLLGAALSAQAQGLAPDVLFEKVSPSVWVVQTSDAQGRPVGRGSAVVTAPGRLVTNCHVLARSSSFVVKRDNVSYGATLEFPDPERDLCQIKVANFTAPAVELADINKLRVGAKVYAIGNPRGLEVTLSDGLISGLRKTDKDELEMVQTTAPISPGSSGGGLFDAEGRLVGITTALLRDSQNLNFAVPATWIVELAARGQANLDKRNAPSAASAGGPATRPGVELPATAPLRVGDSLEYAVTDGFTNVRRTVVYRVDRIEGGRVVFNQGGMVESSRGEMVSLNAPLAGDMDNAMPRGGWGKPELKPGQSWQARYEGNESGGKSDYDLQVSVLSESEIRVGAGSFKAIQIRYTGFVTIRSAALVAGSGSFEATAWYAPDLGRIIRFDVKTNNSALRRISRETVELMRISRAN